MNTIATPRALGDNRFNDGNFQDYLLNVKNRIGEIALENLKERAENSKRTINKWDIDHVLEIKKYYQQKNKGLGAKIKVLKFLLNLVN